MATHLLALLLLGSSRAFAATPLEAEIDTIDAAADDLAKTASELEQSAKPGIYLTEDEALLRFQDCLYLHLVGQHAPAAEGFFALVTTGALATAGLHQDAEWYLAEALVELGNYQTAAARFAAVVENETHPFHDEGVRRLLELYAETGDDVAFKNLYDTKIVPGLVKPTALITYSLAKSFYKKKDFGASKQYFTNVPAGSAFYARARYFLGAIAVVEENFDQARTYFDEVRNLSVETSDDRKVHDLALLGLGRIAYHLRDFDAAFEAYGSISADSAYADEQLYELVWTSIRREQWHDALAEAQIFLLKFPDHEKAPQLRLLEGHLNFQEKNWNDALVSYEQVVQDYRGVRDRFDQLAQSGPEADEELNRFLVSGDPNLPPFAVAMMRADADLGRALDVYADLEVQRSDIEASEQLISELQAFLSGAGAATTYEQMTANAHRSRLRVVEHLLTLLDIQERWLAGLADANVASRLPPLQQQRSLLLDRYKAAEAQMAVATGKLEAFERQLAEHRATVDNARRQSAAFDREAKGLREELVDETDAARVTDLNTRIAGLEAQSRESAARAEEANRQISALAVPDVTSDIPVGEIQAMSDAIVTLSFGYASARPTGVALPLAERVDANRKSLLESFRRLGNAVEAIGQTAQTETGAVRARFDAEVAAVAQERVDYQATATAANAVSLDLTRQGFGRLEDFFADSILKADMGIVDVYWAQKLEIDDELVALREEKDAVVAELERRFTLIREKMGEAP